MSKKIIALVLFVAMMLAMVPVASAAVNTTTTPEIQINNAKWYASATPAEFDITGTAAQIGTSGISAKAERSTDGKTLTVTLSGSYKKAEAYYYSAQTTLGVKGKAVKVPFVVKDVTDPLAPIDVTPSVYVNAVPAYWSSMWDGTTSVYYIDYVLTEADSSASYVIRNGAVQIGTIVIKWDNTDDATVTAATYMTFAPVSKSGDNKANFSIDVKQAANDDKGVKKNDTQFIFNVATTTADDLTKLDASKALVAKYQVYNKAGEILPAGTVVTASAISAFDAAGTATWAGQFLKNNDKFVNLAGTVTYLVDANGCITFTVPGNDFTDLLAQWKAYAYDTTNGIQIGYQKEMMDDIVLNFTYGTKTESAQIDLIFKNVDRTSSGITVLESAKTILKGSKDQVVAYTVNDPAALNQSVTWNTTNKKVVTVDNTGKLTGVGLGTAYVFSTDAKGDVAVVAITVVDEIPVVVVPPVEEVETFNAVVTASALNVRTGPSTSYDKIGKIKRGGEVTVISEVGSWSLIEWEDGEAYVASKYLAAK